MSIRMKEWGMMSLPSRGVHMSADALTGWAASAQRVGEGISAVLSGTAKVLEERAQVTTAGELAGFSERLRTIEQETRDELAEQDVQDWNYAWQKAAAPKLAEAVSELSADARGAGRRLAEAYSARASLEAQRDHELGKIDKARAQWRSRVDEAVQAGDARRAQEWLQAGQGVFVAPQQLQHEQETVQSQASLNRWQQDLQAQPLQALSRLSAAAAEELPTRRQDTESLAYARSRADRAARQEVLQRLVACVEDERRPEAEFVQLAAQAGVLSRAQSESALQEPGALSYEGRRDWLRRIDECPADERAAETLQLDIATAALPTAEKRTLLGRLEQSRRLPERERRSLSRRLWELYQGGALGCPADDEPQQYFATMQQESLARLEQEGLPAAADWLSRMHDLSDRWVCFNPSSHAEQI